MRSRTRNCQATEKKLSMIRRNDEVTKEGILGNLLDNVLIQRLEERKTVLGLKGHVILVDDPNCIEKLLVFKDNGSSAIGHEAEIYYFP